MEESFGTSKISDGLYIGDEFSSKDRDTIVMNHISHIINLNSKYVSNQFETYGVLYLNFFFSESEKDIDKQVILDSLDKNISQVIEFIEETREQGESILIHGVKSYIIGLVFYCAYLMLKYKWSLYKAIEFLENRVSKLQINNSLIRQLRAFQSRISERLKQPLSINWNIYPSMPLQEQTLRNTYMNSFLNSENYKPSTLKMKSRLKVTWEENKSGPANQNTRRVSSKSILKNGGINFGRENSKQRKIQVSSRKSIPNVKQSDKRSVERESQKRLKINNKQQPYTYVKITSESPLVKRRKQQPIQVQVEMRQSIDNKKQKQSSQPPQPFVSLFKNNPIPPRELLNKSLGILSTQRPALNVRFDTDNSAQKQKQKEKQPLKEKDTLKDEVAKKLLKKMILEKGSSIASLQNKQNMVNPTKRKDILSRTKCQSQVVLQKPKKILASERVSEDARKQRQSSSKRTMVNNFMREKTSQSRPQSPVIKKSQPKMDVQKIKSTLQTKIQVRGQSPAASQNRISLKDASALLSTIFPQHNYRPKWKF